MNQRELFFQHLAQTSPAPLALEIVKAEGTELWDAAGKKYLDMIGGISVCNTGHRHPKIVEAIRKQADQYLHLLVYGEFIQSPQVQYAKMLTDHLPVTLNSVYFTNSGAEAVEGAMKLAKRATCKTEIIAFNQSYHGSTQGALSIMGDENWRNAFRPLLPGIRHLDYNDDTAADLIQVNTACVIVEPVQAERGVYPSTIDWMRKIRKKCNEYGALLIFDEIQTGFGRTGSWWAFEQLSCIPDILLLGKALGGGLPLGAFIAKRELMEALTHNPALGHITTFGGHPLSCAAGMASMQLLDEELWIGEVSQKEALFKKLLSHPMIREVRTKGLLIAVEFESFDINKKIIDECIQNGLLTDWFLFAPHCLRIAPPLSISEADILRACNILLNVLRQQ